MKSERIYLLPKDGNLYKANLHCHSTISDGKFTPEELKKMYMAKGYHAIAYTDHRACVPHPELTDDGFVALTGMENAFGIKKGTSVHVCGIARAPLTTESVPDDPDDSISHINAGIQRLIDKNYVTTLNHPRWSGISAENLALIRGVQNMEVVNGFEMIQDGYGDSAACYEMELRRGRRAFPIASDDSHREGEPNMPGYEYFCGFTVLKAPVLTYDALIAALDSGAFYASTGPMINQLWLENGILHVDCSPVCGVYAHGKLYSHRAAEVRGSDCIESIELDVSNICADSDYMLVQLVDTKGKRAWAAPVWFK